MKRFFLVTVAAFALLVPTLTFAQGVKTVYRPEVHGTVIVVPPAPATPVVRAEKVPLTPANVIALHQPMANGYRTANRVNYSAVAHCERALATARTDLRRNF